MVVELELLALWPAIGGSRWSCLHGGDALGQAEREMAPVGVRPVFEEITAIGELCTEHLDDEYAQLCRRLTGKLARKRPSPLLRGDRRIWAAGIVYAIGRVSFLSDAGADPYLRSDELAVTPDM